MNLKNKISFIVSLLFSILFAISATVIYILFSDFRKEEFETRLEEKALSSMKLLVEVEQVDRQLLKIIDQNSINKLYDEKTLIFDANYNLIYSSLDDVKIKWTVSDLKDLKTYKHFFKQDKEQEIYGVFYDTNEQDFYALISATDNFGKRKLEYLLYILIATYIVFTVITWFIVYFLVKKLLFPIDVFHKRLQGINESNLDSRIEVKTKKDEIDLLANEFNKMLERIGESYKKQQGFTANASHELRTPIARMTVQLENKIIAEKAAGASTSINESLLNEINQLSDLTDSLLTLSKLDGTIAQHNEICRIDELIFEAAEKTNKLFPNFKLDLDFLEVENLEVKGNKSLLHIAFSNLFKNAYLYSDSKHAKITLDYFNKHVRVTIANDGKTMSVDEQIIMFEPFMRGGNAHNKTSPGLGLGLRIVKQIFTQHNATIEYSISPSKLNVFQVQLKAHE
jgi:two-component system, OmpR family, sensor histidine kinase ArlS